MKKYQKLLCGFVIVSILPLLINIIVNVVIERDTVDNFQNIAGEMLPGNIALARMTGELYHVVLLLAQYDSTGNTKEREEIEKALASLDFYNTMHQVYYQENNDEHKYAQESIKKITRLVATYILRMNQNANKQELSKIKLKIDEILTDFVTVFEPHIEKDTIDNLNKLEATRQKNIYAQNLQISIGIIILFVAVLFSLFISHRFRKTHLEIENYRNNLEELVAEATVQYEEANDFLEDEIEERRKAETRYRTVADFTYDWESWEKPDGKLEYVSPSCERISGYAPRDFIDNPALLDEIILTEDKDVWCNHRHEAFGNYALREIQLRIRRKDGEVRWIEHACQPVSDNEGNFSGFRASNRDITDRKEAEESLKKGEEEKIKLAEQLRQGQKMESIGTLAGGIAHDFNNILNGIIGYSELVLLDIPESTRSYNFVLEIKKAGLRAAELVRQILTFSRRTDLKRQPLRLQPVVQEVLKLLRSSLPSTIEIWPEIDDCGPVLADFTQVHQILMNLCTNASHAMAQDGGVLAITLQEVEVGQDLVCLAPGLHEGRYVQLAVCDTGCGMDKVTMERIFEPYFTTKEQGEGIGLGLATVHGIVENYGGSIIVESEQGQGTTFKVFFPLVVTENNRAKEKEEKRELPKLNARVLFVDDVEINVQLGIEICELLGCDVTGYTSSLEALAFFRQHPDKFDIVITDQTMPDLTGLKLAQEMFEIRRDLAIIIVTGQSSTIDEEKAKKIGIKDFLMKPFEVGRLAESISKALSKG